MKINKLKSYHHNKIIDVLTRRLNIAYKNIEELEYRIVALENKDRIFERKLQ